MHHTPSQAARAHAHAHTLINTHTHTPGCATLLLFIYPFHHSRNSPKEIEPAWVVSSCAIAWDSCTAVRGTPRSRISPASIVSIGDGCSGTRIQKACTVCLRGGGAPAPDQRRHMHKVGAWLPPHSLLLPQTYMLACCAEWRWYHGVSSMPMLPPFVLASRATPPIVAAQKGQLHVPHDACPTACLLLAPPPPNLPQSRATAIHAPHPLIPVTHLHASAHSRPFPPFLTIVLPPALEPSRLATCHDPPSSASPGRRAPSSESAGIAPEPCVSYTANARATSSSDGSSGTSAAEAGGAGWGSGTDEGELAEALAAAGAGGAVVVV